MVGDASEASYAGFTPNKELGGCINVQFSEMERRAMARGDFSSTLKEAIGLCQMIIVLLQQLSQRLIQSHRIQFIGDNQGCISVFQHMRGQPQIVRQMKMRVCDTETVPEPRRSPQQPEACSPLTR